VLVTFDLIQVIILYDEYGEKQDKFSAKPAEKEGPKNFIVRALCWSPDSCKLAVAQSDKIVFVYRLASNEEKATQWFVKYLSTCDRGRNLKWQETDKRDVQLHYHRHRHYKKTYLQDKRIKQTQLCFVLSHPVCLTSTISFV
jgi:WD40 repeat protein